MKTDQTEIGYFFNIKKCSLFLIPFFIIFLYAFFPVPVRADSSCISVYGATCPSSQLFIEKKVQNPKTGEFVNVLSSSTATFAPDSEVNFRIEVKNTGTAGVSGVFVQDRLPGNIKFVSSNPSGSFDEKSNILSWTMDLNAGESKFIQVKIQVKSASDLNFDISCMTNFVQAQKDAQTAQANAVFCIQAKALKEVPQVTETPRTGPSALLWILSAILLPLGLKLRKYQVVKIEQEKTIKDSAGYICQMRRIIKERGGDK